MLNNEQETLRNQHKTLTNQKETLRKEAGDTIKELQKRARDTIEVTTVTGLLSNKTGRTM